MIGLTRLGHTPIVASSIHFRSMKLFFGLELDFEKLTNDKGLIPWWFIGVTVPLPDITVPMIAFNVAQLARKKAA